MTPTGPFTSSCIRQLRQVAIVSCVGLGEAPRLGDNVLATDAKREVIELHDAIVRPQDANFEVAASLKNVEPATVADPDVAITAAMEQSRFPRSGII